MTTIKLPAWAETVLHRYGPQPAHRAAAPDPAAAQRYAAMTARFRRRWPELAADVWPLFYVDRRLVHVEQAQHLLGSMIDLARAGSPEDLAKKRQALEDLAVIEDELRDLAEQVRRKVTQRAMLMHEHLIAGGIEDDAVDKFGRAAEHLVLQSWAEPRLHNIDISDSINSRKTARDALNLMVHTLDSLEQLLRPVSLHDRARATIYNVTHDAWHYNAQAVKKARADLRKAR
jgi:hypothetical protein